jgi:hypothetical protein
VTGSAAHAGVENRDGRRPGVVPVPWGSDAIGHGYARVVKGIAWVGFGPDGTVKGVSPFNPFLKFQYSNTLQLVKYKKVTFVHQKFQNLAWYNMNLKGTNLLFGRSPNSQQNLN